MKIIRKVGIWLDHANAHIIEFPTIGQSETKVTSKFTNEEKSAAFSKSENLMHNKEQHEQASYFKKLANIIKNYDSVLLFGPTEARVELLNLLCADSQFSKIKIEVRQADKMTENQEYAFVRKYFEMSGQHVAF